MISGSGYRTCDTAYFFLDGTRLGSAVPDETGSANRDRLSVPGDARVGRHDITSSCEPSGDTVLQVSSFQVEPISLHRSALVTSLVLPEQVSTDPGHILGSSIAAMLLLMLIAFPSDLFNSTMEENYDEIRGWFRLPAKAVDQIGGVHRNVAFVLCTLITAVVCGFLSPDFGLNMTSLALVLGMFAAFIVMAVVFSLPADLGIHWACRSSSCCSPRLMNFQPGYFYGALAGLAFYSALRRRSRAKRLRRTGCSAWS